MNTDNTSYSHHLVVLNTDNTSYSHHLVVLNTDNTLYSHHLVVLNTDNTLYSHHLVVMNTDNTLYSHHLVVLNTDNTLYSHPFYRQNVLKGSSMGSAAVHTTGCFKTVKKRVSNVPSRLCLLVHYKCAHTSIKCTDMSNSKGIKSVRRVH